MINPNQTDYSAAIRNWWSEVPTFSKLVLYLCIAGYILGLVFPMMAYMLINIPKQTVEHLQIYRVFTSPFLTLSILQVTIIQLLFELLSYIPTACKTEKRLGSISYLFFFLINRLMYAISYAPYSPWTSNVLYPCAGLWPLIMIEMVIRCNKTPDQPTSLLFCPLQMKSKYYPWIFFVLLSLIFTVIWNLLIGICIGYLHVYNLANWMIISKTFAERLENSIIFAWMQLVGKFVSVNDAEDEDLSFMFVQSSAAGFQMGNYNAQPAQERPSVASFSGTGYKLGGDITNKTRLTKAYVQFRNEEEDKEIEEL